ncbi:MAG: DUF3553 domain-containing protein [Pseudonocardiaceae bacterium]|nr:DUF3553 domain-containing protein [Pseudonocardiaceae bacterium]
MPGRPTMPSGGRRSGCPAGAKHRPFPVSSVVRHQEWGVGTVMGYERDRVVVLFDNVGYRPCRCRSSAATAGSPPTEPPWPRRPAGSLNCSISRSVAAPSRPSKESVPVGSGPPGSRR